MALSLSSIILSQLHFRLGCHGHAKHGHELNSEKHLFGNASSRKREAWHPKIKPRQNTSLIRHIGFYQLTMLTGIACLSFGLIGCKPPESLPDSPAIASSDDQSDSGPLTWESDGWSLKSSWSPVAGSAESVAWADEVEKAVRDDDSASFLRLVDFGPMAERAVRDVSSPQFATGFSSGVKNASQPFFDQLAAENNGYKYICTKETEFGEMGPLFRLNLANGSVNYHHWSLQKDSTGKHRGVDMYVYIAGERMSKTIRRMALLSMPTDDRSLLEKLSGKERAWVADSKSLMQYFDAKASGDNRKVVQEYNRLPPEMQNDKGIALTHVIAATQLNDEATYVDAMEKFQRTFPDDPSAEFVGLDLLLIKREYARLHESLDRLEEAIAKDGHLAVLRASTFLAEEKYDEAHAAATAATEIEPDFIDAFWMLVDIDATRKDHAGVSKTLQTIVNKFGYTEFGMRSNPIYADFVKSPEYQQFNQFLRSKKR